MADIEAFGGCCPHCGQTMLQKNDPNSSGWFKYDACPWCGFAYGTVAGDELRGHKVWESIFEHHNMPVGSTLRDLATKLKVHPQVREAEDFYPSVFDYTKDTPDQIASYRDPDFCLVPDRLITVTDVLTHINPGEFLKQRQILSRVANQDDYVLNRAERDALKALFVTIEHLSAVAGNAIGFDVSGEKP